MPAAVDGPIGLFDSGVGGLTVARALADRLPGERLLYFGDTAHLPYGDKSPEAIRGYSLSIAQHLVDLGAKAIVVACNSASSVAFEALVDALHVPVFNVIDPVVAEVARLDVKRVGIWGTKATIKSGVFPAKLKASAPDAAVRAWATPLLVPVIEENILSGPILDAVIDGYAAPTEAEQVDALVLACTHYPIVASQIGQRMGRNVALLSTPQIVAEHVAASLGHRGLLHSGAPNAPHEFMVSDYTPAFEAIAQQFFGEAISLREDHLWG